MKIGRTETQTKHTVKGGLCTLNLVKFHILFYFIKKVNIACNRF
jgi:hypothetical protein